MLVKSRFTDDWVAVDFPGLAEKIREGDWRFLGYLEPSKDRAECLPALLFERDQVTVALFCNFRDLEITGHPYGKQVTDVLLSERSAVILTRSGTVIIKNLVQTEEALDRRLKIDFCRGSKFEEILFHDALIIGLLQDDNGVEILLEEVNGRQVLIQFTECHLLTQYRPTGIILFDAKCRKRSNGLRQEWRSNIDGELKGFSTSSSAEVMKYEFRSSTEGEFAIYTNVVPTVLASK